MIHISRSLNYRDNDHAGKLRAAVGDLVFFHDCFDRGAAAFGDVPAAFVPGGVADTEREFVGALLRLILVNRRAADNAELP